MAYDSTKRKEKARSPKAIEARFWKHVHVGPKEQCWPWLAAKCGSGYGRLNVKGRLVASHRMSYEMAYGVIRNGAEICHHCDNKICVNPAHLFLGTRSDNMLDMYRKGRHPFLKVDAKQYEEIMKRLAYGESQQSIANDFGLSQVQVSRLKLGRIKRFSGASSAQGFTVR